nr:PREDICTED: nicotinamidase-like [Linepithema humile]
MAQPANDTSVATILSRLDTSEFDYKKFRAFCVELFDTNEIKEHEWRVREIFELFDANADGRLHGQELDRCRKWAVATLNPVNILLVVDVQNDFIDGTLALRKCGYEQDAAEVIEPINRLLKDGRWDKVMYTQDWHPENHISFFENLAARNLHSESKVTKKTAQLFDAVVFSQPYVTQILWPKHCVMDSWGAEFHKDLLVLPSAHRLYKGRNPDKDSYSVFAEKDADGTSELEKILSTMNAVNLFICGIAYDVCVKETCLDGLQLGYPLAIADDSCRGVKPDDIKIAKNLIIEKGGLITSSDHILSIVNEGKRSLVMAHHTARQI